ncbi:hypothetical protein PC116_g20268 [Phytophthora cactorum]|nr:hypothetical protein PC116_g20268 [Phytophthora cactorum]
MAALHSVLAVYRVRILPEPMIPVDPPCAFDNGCLRFQDISYWCDIVTWGILLAEN